MRFVAITVLASAAACFSKPPRPGEDTDAKPPSDSPSGDFLDGFQFRKRVTIAAGSQETLANFPVGISIVDPDLDAHARSDGKDLVATALDGTTLLASEVTTYKTGALEMWVRMPELAETGGFYLYYGGAQQAGNPTAVWDGPVFASVWHLSDSGQANDSTAAGNDMNGTGSETPDVFADGIFGSARELAGMAKITAGDPANNSLDFGVDSFSFSVWVHQTAQGSGNFDTPFLKGGLTSNEAGYCLLLGSLWTAKISDGAQHIADPELGPPILNDWAHVTAVVDRATSTMTVYLDDVVKDSKSIAGVGSVSTASSVQIGRGTTEPFFGRLDELRVYKTALTPSWIATEFRNGRDPSFLTLSPEEQR